MDDRGERPVYALHPRMQRDPHFRDHLLFFEYFHGDSGRGVGASHQTGWTGLIAKLLMPRYARSAAVTAAPAADADLPELRVPRQTDEPRVTQR
jgi:hypothetical protein